MVEHTRKPPIRKIKVKRMIDRDVLLGDMIGSPPSALYVTWRRNGSPS